MTSKPEPAEAEYQYVVGQGRPSFPSLLRQFEEQSAEVASSSPHRLDQPYGAGERQCFDFFPALSEPRLTLVYLHAGYWQSRDKGHFRFVAPAFTRVGVNVALVNYPLCPSVTVSEIVSQVRDSIPAIVALAGDPKLVLSGHSAGAHLAIELALTDWTAEISIQRVVALSGVFDLAPLIQTSLNQNLRLSAEQAADASPVHRVKPSAPPALFAVGGEETSAFIAQTARMGTAWRDMGNSALVEVVPFADHFSILQSFANPDSAIFRFAAMLG